MKLFDSLKLDINYTFNNINDKLVTVKSGLKKIWLFSSWKIKDSIIEAL